MNKLTLILASLALAFLAGCAGMVAAQTITGVSEIAAGNALQRGSLTLPQLTTLTNDLAAFPQTPFPQADTPLVANLIKQLVAHKQANLTDASVVDAASQALSAFNNATPPTAIQGVAWANLQDIILGLKAEIKEAAANPQLVPVSP